MTVDNRFPDVRSGPRIMQKELRHSGKLHGISDLLQTVDNLPRNFGRSVVGERVAGAAQGVGQPVAVEAGAFVPVGEAGDERAGLSYHSLKQSLKNFWGTNC
jgi:hypothetical protein